MCTWKSLLVTFLYGCRLTKDYSTSVVSRLPSNEGATDELQNTMRQPSSTFSSYFFILHWLSKANFYKNIVLYACLILLACMPNWDSLIDVEILGRAVVTKHII